MYGIRQSILAQFGWSWDYLLWGIKWHVVQKMLIDAPNYVTKKDDKESNGKKVKTRSLRDLLEQQIQQQNLNK